jgi:hypothetical protein
MAISVCYLVLWGEHVCGAYRLDTVCGCGRIVGDRCAEEMGCLNRDFWDEWDGIGGNVLEL